MFDYHKEIGASIADLKKAFIAASRAINQLKLGESKMKVKELAQEVENEITEERANRIKKMLKEKKKDMDAAKHVYEEMQKNYDKLLEMDVDDYVFPHEDSCKQFTHLSCNSALWIPIES